MRDLFRRFSFDKPLIHVDEAAPSIQARTPPTAKTYNTKSPRKTPVFPRKSAYTHALMKFAKKDLLHGQYGLHYNRHF
jgi:hypothetical protein